MSATKEPAKVGPNIQVKTGVQHELGTDVKEIKMTSQADDVQRIA